MLLTTACILLTFGPCWSMYLINPLDKYHSTSNKSHWISIDSSNIDRILSTYRYSLDSSYSISSADTRGVYCGGEYWTEGELLGTMKNGEIHTAIIEGRIYLRQGSEILENTYSALLASEAKYKNNAKNSILFDKCVNTLDPSTRTIKSLGATTPDGIYCNGILIKDKMLMGTYYESPNRTGRRVDMYATINKKFEILRIAYQRDGDAKNFDKIGSSLMEYVVKGYNGSFLSSEVDNFTMDDIKGCFYNELPKYPDQTPECSSDLAVKEITYTDENKIAFSFSGTEVHAIKWIISDKLNGAPLASGVTEQLNGAKSTTISYPSLLPGNYILTIQGANCASPVSNAINFSIQNKTIETISSFNARETGGSIELSWETVLDRGNTSFEIVRYNNDITNSHVIGVVSVKDHDAYNYKFIDKNPLLGINNYQLKTIDADHRQHESKTTSVNYRYIYDLKVAPNPASEYIDLEWTAHKSDVAVVEIFTTSGTKVHSQNIHCNQGANSLRIKVKRLEIGNHVINISMH